MESNDQSWDQMEPGSTFLANLNSQSEHFQQAAIVGLTDQRWSVARTAATSTIIAFRKMVDAVRMLWLAM